MMKKAENADKPNKGADKPPKALDKAAVAAAAGDNVGPEVLNKDKPAFWYISFLDDEVTMTNKVTGERLTPM